MINQTNLLGQPLKTKAEIRTEKKEVVGKLLELVNVFARPKIVMSGYADMEIPDNIRSRILMDRLILAKTGEKLATEIETLWYISTASLANPLDHSWCNIMMYLTRKWIKAQGKEIPDFLREQIELEEIEEMDLHHLRSWLYKKSVEAVKNA